MTARPRRSGAAWRLAYAALLAASALALAGTRLEALEILSHFQAWLAGAWIAMLAVLALSPRAQAAFWRPRRASALGAAALLLHAGLVGWLWLPDRDPAPARETVELRVVNFNMRHSLAALEAARRALADDPPDVWVLLETTRDVRLEGYEHVLHDEPHLLGIWSRFPLEEARALPVPGERDQLLATVAVGRMRLPLLAVHWRIPTEPAQRRALDAAIGVARERDHLLAIGDFNSTPWSPRLRRLLREGGLRRPAALGARGTWSPDPWGLLSLPIDQLLTKGDVRVEALEFLPWDGSDHRPLLARVTCSSRR